MTAPHTFERKTDKLAVVGSHRITRDGAPYDDPTWDIWVFNEAAMMPWCGRATATFDIHQEKNYTNTNGIASIDKWGWLQQDHPGMTIWMQDVDERIPNSVRFPLDELIAHLPATDPLGTGKGFFTSTPCYALALGLYLGYTTIHTWGVDLSSNTEYKFQANCWRYWCGVAKGMLGDGFKIVRGGEALFTAKRYGYDDDPRVGADYYKKRIAFHDADWARRKKRADELKTEMIAVLDGHGEPKRFVDLFPEAQKAAQEYGELVGAMGESTRWAERADILHRQEFEWHAAKANEAAPKANDGMVYSTAQMEIYFNNWVRTHDIGLRTGVTQCLDKALASAYELGRLRGVYKENVFYLDEFDQRLIQTGEASDEILAVSGGEAIR